MQHDEAPAPPWTLRGEAIIAVRSVPIAIARSFLPAHLRPVSVLPGHTLGMFYLARYDTSPVGAYHEWLLAPALVRVGVRLGAWISHIVVDSARSLHAGRELWALPKSPGSFTWFANVRTLQSEHAELRLTLLEPRRAFPIPLLGAALTRHEERSMWFTVHGKADIQARRGQLTIGNPELRRLGFERCRTFYVLQDLTVRIGVPRPLALRA